MSYIALEEAFAVPALASRQPPIRIRSKADFFAYVNPRLVDVDQLRIADMDEHGIDIQVLSLTAPGIQAHADAAQAHEDAAFANDFLADAVAKHPTRFAGFAAGMETPERWPIGPRRESVCGCTRSR